MTIVKASTSKGKRLLSLVTRCCWGSLANIYYTWSESKQQAFVDYLGEYYRDKNACRFGVGCPNSFGFSASWYCEYEGKPAYRLETPNNSYVILLNE